MWNEDWECSLEGADKLLGASTLPGSGEGMSPSLCGPPPWESFPTTSPGPTDSKGYVPGAGVSSWSPEGGPGSEAGFVLTDGAGCV